MMELVGTDTMKSEVLSFYGELGRCTKVIALRKDELSSELTEGDKPITYYNIDNKYGSSLEENYTVDKGGIWYMRMVTL